MGSLAITHHKHKNTGHAKLKTHQVLIQVILFFRGVIKEPGRTGLPGSELDLKPGFGNLELEPDSVLHALIGN